MNRQRIRKTILFISFLLFPITIWYFSPYLIIQAMFQHILNGSFWVFLALLVTSVFSRRAWCSHLCPAGGIQECCSSINNSNAKQGKRDYIKYVIWTVWIVGVIVTYILGKNEVTIDFFYMTDHGISVTEVYNYVIYYGIMLILVMPSLIHGKRATCHYICWMAPFMVIGGKIGHFLHLPQLHIEADKTKCISCRRCNKVCSMGLDVVSMVNNGKLSECSECIQCSACVDECPNRVLKLKFSR